MSLIDEFDETELDQVVEPVAGTEVPSAPVAEPEEESKADRSHLIPRHRYNFQRDQRMAAEQRAQQLEQELLKYQEYLASVKQQQQAQPQGPTVEDQLAEYDKRIEDARADGDTQTVSRLRGEQRRLEHQALAYQVRQNLPQQTPVDQRQIFQQASDNLRLEKLIDNLEQEYPMLDQGHSSFDAEMSEEVMTVYDALLKQMPAPQAMERAVVYVTNSYGVVPVSKTTERKTNVKRNVEASRSQPPDLSGFGYDSSRGGITRPVDVMKMTQEQFEALGDKEIEKLLATA